MPAAPALTWREIKRNSVAAVEARLAAFVRAGARGTPISPDGAGVPALGERLEVYSSQRRRWFDQQYYVVDVELGAGQPDDRHLVTLVRFDGPRIIFDVPAKTREALAGVRSVRVFGVDGMRVRLAEDLRKALKNADEGPLVEALWRERKALPKRARKNAALNVGQRQALTALTSKGSAFVWGPPGTGKTKVITEAVKHALDEDRTVLIASHTHVAVDNVLEGLVDLVEIEPGDVVRVASPMTEEKVSTKVAEHDFLLLRKAVEVMTDEVARRADLDDRAVRNRADPARRDVDELSASEDDREERAAAVAELDAELEAINEERSALDEEVRETRADLLAEASVVACTLASLCAHRLDRRFDVVILDEAASIEPPYVAVAGARAKRTFGLVGDFLQNAPIAEAADDADESAEDPWLASNVFSLAGIEDRASAEAHPRCVALRRQYRYPSVVAELANGICYDGLLESERPSDPDDGATVTLIDTSAMQERRLVQAFPNSWWSPLGLELFAIVGGHHARRGADVGYVTPYRAQAERARETSDRLGLGIECGTAHRFQGRQFEVVVFDLMQDDRVRWAGAADLHGTPREASAAKLLNVGLTRMRRQLYLFGDWQFVRTHDSPGMRALAGLEVHPNFRLVDARDVVRWARQTEAAKAARPTLERR